jgi:uncharacterized protein with NAD-binding domain and iron-sulfur cluster
MNKQRVAILGGGVGAITAAWALTNLPNAKDRFDITIYSLGWRLGGKGASGRNAEYGQRIEEHGLHIWMGFYDNAFRAMQQCYGELNRPPTCPVRTWTDAFVRHDNIVLYEFANRRWRDWAITVPTLPGTPGTDRKPSAVRDLFEALLKWMHDTMTGPMHEAAVVTMLDKWRDQGRPGWVESELLALEGWVLGRGSHAPGHMAWLISDLHAAVEQASAIAARSEEDVEPLLGHLEAFIGRLAALAHDFIEAHDEIRRLWVLMDLGVAVARGIIKDGVLTHGFDRISGVDFREWIHNHGASQETKACSVVRTMYDLCFAYVEGELDRPNMDAAVFLRTIMLMGFTFRGSFMYRMSAGMGDIVFAPYYEALKQRGVKFEFFQRVTSLGLSPDRSAVASITIDRQVALKKGIAEYQPFVNVKGLPCWPSTPLFDQIENGDALAASGQSLESSWCTWPAAETRVLRQGEHFDKVILGISVGALSDICGELIEANQSWKNMCANVLTVETQGVQLWLKAPLADLGWVGPPSVAGTYAEPLDTWCDMSDLLAREDWPPEAPPQAIMYLCGPLRHMIPGQLAPEWPRIRHQQVLNVARTWVQSHTGVCLPKSAGAHNPSGLDLKWLHAPTKPHNPLLDQYLRANIDPSERYVLSVAGSSSSRIRGSESGFSNLALAGDWVWTPINAGCVEAATMGGLDAARAISGDDIHVFGWAGIEKPGQGVDE